MNIYKFCYRLVKTKLLWDLSFKSFIHKNRIKKWKNNYLNQKAIILCNGPSLNSVDFDLIKENNVFTIGLNKINLLFSSIDFRPDIIISVNPYILKHNKDFYNKTDIPLFLDKYAEKIICHNKKNIHLLFSNYLAGTFSYDCSSSVTQGYTVTYVALQLAYYFGFKFVALVGCDHYFQEKGMPNEVIVQKGKDLNHFHFDYFTYGEQWQLPDLIGSEFHYQKAKEIYEKNNRKIYNCTNKSKLELFEKTELINFIKT